MACGHCGDDGHNVQTCPRVRRCGHCSGRGHDRRNCPKLSAPTRQDGVLDMTSIEELSVFRRAREPLLAHLYWERNQRHFDENLARLRDGDSWTLVATTGHGVHTPPRSTVNLFSADATFFGAYEDAAKTRRFPHGILIKRGFLEAVSSRPGYEFAEVRIGHPHGYQVTDPDEFWKFDIGQHRYTSVGVLRYATVIRLATPEHWRLRRVHIPREALVACW